MPILDESREGLLKPRFRLLQTPLVERQTAILEQGPDGALHRGSAECLVDTQVEQEIVSQAFLPLAPNRIIVQDRLQDPGCSRLLCWQVS